MSSGVFGTQHSHEVITHIIHLAEGKLAETVGPHQVSVVHGLSQKQKKNPVMVFVVCRAYRGVTEREFNTDMQLMAAGIADVLDELEDGWEKRK